MKEGKQPYCEKYKIPAEDGEDIFYVDRCYSFFQLWKRRPWIRYERYRLSWKDNNVGNWT
jgi:hypothetical protein